MTTSATPAIYWTRIRHVRAEPVRHAFEYRSYSWFVDLDELPRTPWWLRPFAGFRAEDHLDAPGADLRDRVDAFLVARGVDLHGGRVTALLNARVLGYVFNPLSLYWCHDDTGALRCVLAEVHNTYGQRHCYLVYPDDRGNAHVDKRFYVSPFHDVTGRYAMHCPEPHRDLTVSVVLHRDGHAPFAATMRGRRHPATPASLLRAQLRAPLAPLMVSVRIRLQGITLWARGVPVTARPDDRRQERVR